MANVANVAVTQTVDVAWGGLAGLVMGLAQALFGSLFGTVVGAVGAGMIHKKQADTIALLAGWSLVMGTFSRGAAASTSGANEEVM